VWLFQGVHNYPMKHIRAIYMVPSILCVSSQHLAQSRCVRFTGTPSASSVRNFHIILNLVVYQLHCDAKITLIVASGYRVTRPGFKPW